MDTGAGEKKNPSGEGGTGVEDSVVKVLSRRLEQGLVARIEEQL